MGAELLAEVAQSGQDVIANTKAQLQLVARALPPEEMRTMRLVFLKLDEARLWMGEIGRG